MTGPNKCSSNVVSNVVTVTVFGNFYEEKNVADICGSIRPPARPNDSSSHCYKVCRKVIPVVFVQTLSINVC